jgi:hypothetical protein
LTDGAGDCRNAAAVKWSNVAPTKSREEIIGNGPIDLSASAHYARDNGCSKKRDSKHSNNQEDAEICFHQELTPVSYDHLRSEP